MKQNAPELWPCTCRGKPWCRTCRAFVNPDHPYKTHELLPHDKCNGSGKTPFEPFDMQIGRIRNGGGVE